MAIILIEIPLSALQYGFVNDPVGTHGSRTIMLSELRLLLQACPPGTTYEGFRQAIVDENVLLKKTETTRKESFRRLRELYGLDEESLLFRSLRDLWSLDPAGQPLLAVLCASARDVILRATASLILAVPEGEAVTPQMLENAAEESLPQRYNPTSLANIGRHTASSWQQSGHLHGRLRKVRRRASSGVPSTTYALLLSYLCGARGDALFHTLWAQLLDTPVHLLREQAFQASQQGWLEYRHAGAVTEITFRHLLRATPPETSRE
jgi:hypothetical protein